MLSWRRKLGLIAVLVGSLVLPSSVAVTAQSSPPKEQQKPPQIQKPKKDETVEEPGEQVSLSARLVNVFFSASDNRNALITDIRRDEVKVLENGQSQEIFTFARQTDMPLTITLLIDVSGSQEYTLPEEKRAAAQFIRSIIRPGKDVVAVAEFRDEVILVEDFTSSPNRLVNALDRIRFTPRTSTDMESKFGGTSLYDAVYLTSNDLLGKQPGRRTILLLTDGEDTTSYYKLQDAVDQALRVEATVFSIGIGDRFRYGVDKKVLQRLSQDTGGRAYFPTNSQDLAKAFREIENELRSQYLIAYYPSTSAPGSYRTIEVRVPTRKNVKVRHRRGYYAPKQVNAGG
jgi:VWFA-related protein